MSRKCLNHSATMSPNAPLRNARAEGSVTPKANQNSVCLLLNRGPQSKPRFICLLWGKAKVRVAQTIEQSDIGQCNLVTERDKPRFICLLWGKAEVRVALIWVPKINDQIVYFGRAEVHVAQ